MKFNETNSHFTDDKSYCGPGCISPHDDKEVIGNQPNITDADSTEEIRSQSIPHYPGNPCKMGDNY